MRSLSQITTPCRSTVVRGLRVFVAQITCVWRAAVVAALLGSSPLLAQSTLQNLMRNDATTAGPNTAPTTGLAGSPYTFKSGDFRLLVGTALELDWNDNVGGANSAPQQDFILLPTLTAGVGYSEYLEHPQYDALYISSGTQLAFNVFVGDFRFTFHEMANCSQDTGGQSAVAGTAFTGAFNNSAGVQGTWNLRDLIFGMGFDYQNSIPLSSSVLGYTGSSTEVPALSAGFKFRPNLTAGIESSASFTTYNEEVLNNSQSYTFGLYADWKPDLYLTISARAGYGIYDFGQTSQSADVFRETPTGGAVGGPAGEVIRTADQGSWYAGLTLSHQITEHISYGANFSHEITPGLQSDASAVSSASASVNWSITKNLSLHSTLNYTYGQSGVGSISGNLSETYSYFNGGLSANYAITKALSLNVNYRRSMRFSDMEAGSYGQDLVSLQLTYRFL
jgi:hypothetical protein